MYSILQREFYLLTLEGEYIKYNHIEWLRRMASSELQLKNLLKHYLVREFKERGVEAMCINEYLPLCAALLYPYVNDRIISDEKTKGTIVPIIDSIKKYTKRLKGLETYSLEGLRRFFKVNWMSSIDPNTQKSLLADAVSLITTFEDNGYFSINGNEKVVDVYLNGKVSYPDVSGNYGSDDYAETIEQNAFRHQNDENIPILQNDVTLNPLKEFLLTNFPLNVYPNTLKTYDYFWEYKLNSNQYDNLKDILIGLDLQNNKNLLNRDIPGYGTVARSIALYISEWYKRESTSLSGDRCLEELKLDSGDSSRIWDNAHLPQSYLHKEDVREKNRRQTAMCTLGGLPLKYVVKENPERFEKFVNELFNIQNREEEIVEEDIESIVDCFDDRNQLFKRSLKSGSCKEYLKSLVDYLESGNNEDLPFAESDMGNSPFSEFIKTLQEGYDKALPSNFFQKEIRIWTYDFMEEDDDSNLIESEFYVHIGFFKSNNVITTRELSKLGIMLPPEASMFDAKLKITLKDGSCTTTDEKRTYHKIGNHCDDFCGAFGSSLATSIDLFKTKDIALLIECGEYCKEFHLYTIPSYLELYATDNGFLWTTKKNKAAQKVVFYDKSIYAPSNEDNLDIQTKSFEENNWGWIYLTEAINLKDSTGEEITIGLEESELIMVDFKVKSLRKEIELSKDGCVECVIQDDDITEIPLLYFDDRKRPALSCDGMRGKELLENYKIDFKQISSHNYSEWTTNNVPPQGFLSIRLSCHDERKKKKQRKLEVYFIPGTYPIVKRNLKNNYIYIKGENVCILDESLRDNLTPADNNFNYKYKDSCDNLKSSIIPFRIGDDDNHIILKVYRSFNWTQILNNGKTIKDITNDGSERPPIALIIQKNIHLQVVNEEGYKIYSPCYQRYLDYFRDPRNLSFVKNGNGLSGFYIDDSSQPFLYCVYISSFDDNGKIRKIEKKKDDRGNEYVLLNVSEDYINEYALFYWSGELEDNPVKLEPGDLNKKPYHLDIPNPLSGKAVVFQSLCGCSPNLYFRPFYDGVKWDNYIQRYGGCGINYIIKCYELAVEHNTYFCVFPAIRNLQKRKMFSEFIREYAKLKNYIFSRKDEINLTRLAKELSMDWYFADSKILYDRDENHNKWMRECMRRILLKSPINKAVRNNDKKLCNEIARAMNNYGRDYDGCNNTEYRINFLNQFTDYIN